MTPETSTPTRSGSNRANSALSNPRLPPDGGVPPAPAPPASTIPTRLGGGGVSTSSVSGRAANPFLTEPGEVARNCVARAFQLPARRGRFCSAATFLSSRFSPETEHPPGDAPAFSSDPETDRDGTETRLRPSHDKEASRKHVEGSSSCARSPRAPNGASPRSSARSASASRKYTDASRRPPPGAAAAANAYVSYASDDDNKACSVRGRLGRLLREAASLSSAKVAPEPSDEDEWKISDDDARVPLEETPDMPSEAEVSDETVVPESREIGGALCFSRRVPLCARSSGGGFQTSILSFRPASRLSPRIAKATAKLAFLARADSTSSTSSRRRSAARRAYLCAGSARSSACSVRKNTTSCLYAAETESAFSGDLTSDPPPDPKPSGSGSWRNTHRSTKTLRFSPSASSDSMKISSTMRRERGRG